MGRAGRRPRPVDHTARSGPQRVRDLPSPDEAEESLKGHVPGVINLWRPIRGQLQGRPPLACDARTVDPKDLVPSDLISALANGRQNLFRHVEPGASMTASPEMKRDEALLLKDL